MIDRFSFEVSPIIRVTEIIRCIALKRNCGMPHKPQLPVLRATLTWEGVLSDQARVLVDFLDYNVDVAALYSYHRGGVSIAGFNQEAKPLRERGAELA